jgi:hypothetical protein
MVCTRQMALAARAPDTSDAQLVLRAQRAQLMLLLLDSQIQRILIEAEIEAALEEVREMRELTRAA